VGIMEKRNRSKKNELSFLGDSLPAIYATKRWKHQWRLFRLVQDWPTIIGTEVARLTAPAFFRQDVLWIFVQDSAWMQHMQFIKLDLMARVNKIMTEQPVTDIRWLLQPEILPVPERHTPAPHPVDPEQEQLFHVMTEGIDNQECRQALQRLWHTFASHTK
jgi:hypothetical protein